jgi:hypothetical protein
LYLRVEWNKELKEKYKRETDRQTGRAEAVLGQSESFNKGRG